MFAPPTVLIVFTDLLADLEVDQIGAGFRTSCVKGPRENT
jgi:hypothetical protein